LEKIMNKYTVISRIKGSAGNHEAGEVISLSDKEAAELLALGVVVAAPAEDAPIIPTDPVIRHDAIIAAISQLDTANADLWLKDGKPAIEAIAAITGWSPTSAERNAACGN
jgi:hypothetical protein